MQRSGVLAICVVMLPILGCGSDGAKKGVTVKGKVHQGGQILKPAGPVAPGASKVEVIFYTSETDGVHEQAVADSNTGEFTLTGAGKGIKPGKYKVGVFVRGAGWDSDDLKGKFNEKNTPISVEIPEDKVGQTYELPPIDIDNPPKG